AEYYLLVLLTDTPYIWGVLFNIYCHSLTPTGLALTHSKVAHLITQVFMISATKSSYYSDREKITTYLITTSNSVDSSVGG
ncbi:MAG: hypothetical protein JXR12_14205, partial [Neptunomonas phycophila]|uniref:hypothetical protein n=1 Tax=Neptunomonas phycophila TaxID=1572645 RepID=UPI003B8BE60D